MYQISDGETKMPHASELLTDGFLQRYGAEDMFKVYYTCFPVDKNENLYECLKGKFDACYSDKFFWSSRGWKEVGIPKIIPSKYHVGYAQYKINKTVLNMNHGK